MRNVATKVYQFSELSDEAKAMAIEDHRHVLADHEWHENIIDSFTVEIAPAFGVDCKDTHFTGFWSQGDGACFEGSFEYRKGMTEAVRRLEIYNSDGRSELLDIAQEMASLQKSNFYGLYGSAKHSGMYCHSRSVTIDVRRDGPGYSGDIDPAEGTDEAYAECLRDLMDWLYRQLEEEYEYLTSDEGVSGWLKDQGYEFTADGELHA